MAYALVIKEEADREIFEAYLYYEEQRQGLGEAFLEHLEDYFNRITVNPQHFPQKRPPYHEAFIRRFPFVIIYEVAEDRILVYAVFHTRQNPEKKRE